MKFSHDVVGPDFEQCDIVSFEFRDATLTFPLPEHLGDYDSFLASQDLREVPGEGWKSHPLGQRRFPLVSHTWHYDDLSSGNHVVIANFEIELAELSPKENQDGIHLAGDVFEKWLFHHYRLIAVRGVEDHLDTETETLARKEYLMPETISDIEKNIQNSVTRLTATLGHASVRDCPDWMTYIPLNKDAILIVSCGIHIFSSDHDAITIPKPELDQLRKDIRDEILDNISVTYSSEFSGLLEHS